MLLINFYIILFFNVLWLIIYPKQIRKIATFKYGHNMISIFYYFYMITGIIMAYAYFKYDL